MWKKGLSFGIILLFLGANVILEVSASCTNTQMPQVIQQHIQAIKQDVIGQTPLTRNVLISNNPRNDSHPRMTTNGLGHTIVVYEQEIKVYRRQVPVVYSADGGQTWTMQFLFDSIDFTAGSGILQYPDITYNAFNDVLYLTMIDPNAEMYNNEMAFIPGNIANATDATWYGISGAADGYFYGACACTNNFFMSIITTNASGIIYTFQLAWFLFPDFEFPPNIGGFYYDSQARHRSAPAAEIEMDSNSNQLFIVCETRLDSGTKITIKTNVMDEDLITSGVQQNGMDKYADIEQMPSEYLGFGTDPDVSGSGNKVCIIYVEDGNVVCKSSTTSAVYEPGFNWQTSIVENNASAPVIYMIGNNAYCAYVKGGNLYLKLSEDGGVIWGAAEQKNDVDGTVVAEKGAVDICKSGIAFTDTRNGNYDIYYASYEAKPTPQIVIASISGGFGVTAVIKNIGDAPSETFNWSITAEGNFLKGGLPLTGTGSLPPGVSMGIKRFMVGFGAVTVTVTVDTATVSKDFKLFVIYFKEV